VSKIEKWEVQTVKECMFCEHCDQEMIALDNSFYIYKCPKCGKEEHNTIKYPRIILT